MTRVLWGVLIYAALKFSLKMNLFSRETSTGIKQKYPKMYDTLIDGKTMEKVALILVIIASATLLAIELRAIYLKRKNG